jgi:hypothetical protein
LISIANEEKLSLTSQPSEGHESVNSVNKALQDIHSNFSNDKAEIFFLSHQHSSKKKMESFSTIMAYE